MTLFVDMDGVLADFDAGHEIVFGVRADKLVDNVDWEAVRNAKDFYLNLPPMPDLDVLWSRIERYRPIVLTGVPLSVEEAPENKRAWVLKHLGSDVEVRCCVSMQKCLHAMKDDILIDDWDKYRDLWIARGGFWVTHRSAAETIVEIDRLERSASWLLDEPRQTADFRRRYDEFEFEDAARCVAEVYRYPEAPTQQCSRKRGHGPKGRYCSQHAKANAAR